MIQFSNFDVRIETFGQGYRAVVVRSPFGEASQPFQTPFEVADLDALDRGLGRGRDILAAADDATAQPPIDVRAMGQRLYDAIFAGDVGHLLSRSLDATDGADAGLRIRLRLNDVPELARLPWEQLFHPTQARHLALSRRTPVIRYLEMSERIAPVRSALPLRILTVVAAPRGVETLDVEGEQAGMREAIAELADRGKASIQRADRSTLPALRAYLTNSTAQVLHFIGHGGVDPTRGGSGLILEDEVGDPAFVGADDLAVLLHDARSVRLVVLNLCHGAASGPDDIFSGVATGLARQARIPAVVAMRAPITDRAAITFAGALYGSLADGEPVDVAVTEGRKAIFAAHGGVEWGTPILFMRSDDGALFDIDRPTTGPIDRMRLRDALVEKFDLVEMKDLCFSLAIDWDDIKGESKTSKVTELIDYCRRRGRLQDLVEEVRKARGAVI